MHVHLELKADRNEGFKKENSHVTYYPVSDIFWETCKVAGVDLIVEARIISLYEEGGMKYPSNRILLETHNGKRMIGFRPNP